MSLRLTLAAAILAVTPFAASAASFLGSGTRTFNGPSIGSILTASQLPPSRNVYLANHTAYYANPIQLPQSTKSIATAYARLGAKVAYIKSPNGRYITAVTVTQPGVRLVLPGTGARWSFSVTAGQSTTYTGITSGSVVHNKDGTTTRYVTVQP